MRRLALSALALAALSGPAGAQAPAPALLQRYQATITPAELAGHLYVYADDVLAGRETGEPGQRFAARYLAGQYQTMGVAARGSGVAGSPYAINGYLQPFALEQTTLRSLTVTATRDGSPLFASTIRPDSTAGAVLVPAYGQVESDAPARVVFVGTADTFAGVDLDGAYALASPGTAADPSDQGATQARLAALGAAGVRGVILGVAPTASALAPQAARAFRGGRLALPAAAGAEAEGGGLPPIFLTGQDVVQQLLSGTPLSAGAAPTPTNVMLAIASDRETVQVQTENVVAMVEGSDLADEFVVVSAHLDHIGVQDAEAGEDGINNGADDDGSGTVALLEIAEAFQAARDNGHGPRRSVLFLHVTGEEKGLLGSEYYADHEPLVPLANTVADLNIDMIGRQDPTYEGAASPYVYILGAELISTDIDAVNARVNAETGLGIDLSKRFNSPDDPNQFFRRSDHWNFGKHGVPFIFYFTGTHEDYHQPGDEADKIDYDRMALIARLVFGTAWEIANADGRPAVSGTGFN
ncbi:MAG TPA: M28 family peptidase [Rubricoccaceae bacterium]